jgi:hypothetical protein
VRDVVEAPIELLVETLQKGCDDFARQRMIVAKGPRRLSDETTVYFDGTNQHATVPLTAKKMLFVNALRQLKLEADRISALAYATRAKSGRICAQAAAAAVRRGLSSGATDT